MNEELYLSEDGLKELQDELKGLLDQRKAITEKIKEAREYGDLSENAEYQEAKSNQSFVEGRIEEIQSILKMAKVMNNSNGNKEISLGSKVRVKLSEKHMEYHIVGSNEANPMEGKISNESPIGQALLGRRKGDKVAVTTPAGEQELLIVEIS